jgi:hypothetical protein
MFSSEPEPIDIQCDAPPLYIVRGCEKLGLRTPQDVRWCHASHLPLNLAPQAARASATGWKALLGMSEPQPTMCTCHQPLPALEKYTFMLRSGGRVHYFLVQCGHCRTIYWREG